MSSRGKARSSQRRRVHHASGKKKRYVELYVPVWAHIRMIREAVVEILKDHGDEVRNGAMMVASELVENALKYHMGESDHDVVKFVLALAKAGVKIEVTNKVAGSRALEEVRTRIEKIQRAESKEALYLSRLEEILADPAQSGGLGLYRIAFEGKCELRCASKKQVLTVTATRSLS